MFTLAAQLPLQLLDLILEPGIITHLLVDLAYRVQHRRVIAVAEATADLRQRPGREVLGQIHTDLPRPHHRAVATLGEYVLFGHGEMPRHDAQDVLDLDAPRFDALH